MATNVQEVLARVAALGEIPDSGRPAEVVQLIDAAVDPVNIAGMGLTWHPWC